MNSSPHDPTPTPPGPEIAAFAVDLTRRRPRSRWPVFGVVVNTLAVLLLVVAIFTIQHQRVAWHRQQVKVNHQVAVNTAETDRLAALSARLVADQREVSADVNRALCAIVNGLTDFTKPQTADSVKLRAAIDCPRPVLPPKP